MRAVMLMLIVVLCVSASYADTMDAATVDSYVVLHRGTNDIAIDADLGDWSISQNVLVMGEASWTPLGGNWDGPEDKTAELQVLYDESNLYFALAVTDSEHVTEGANPWENDGPQMAIDASAGQIPAGWPNATTHLYNFSTKDGWIPETGPFAGDAELATRRDDATQQTIFEWRMPTSIFADPGVVLEAGVEIAFAIIINDSDLDAKGQTGWVGWGSNAIVFGKNPEEMKTLVLGGAATAVEPEGKLATTWGASKR